MLFDMHRLLDKFRKNGYVVREVQDSSGRTCWDVYWRDIGHDFSVNRNIVNRTYIGKVEKYGKSDRAPFGRPYFYYTWLPGMQKNDMVQEAISIAEGHPRTKVLKQTDPSEFRACY